MTRIYATLYFHVYSFIDYDWKKAIRTIDLTNFKSNTDPTGRLLTPIGNWSEAGIDSVLKRLSEEKKINFLSALSTKFGKDYRIIGIYFMYNTDVIIIDDD